MDVAQGDIQVEVTCGGYASNFVTLNRGRGEGTSPFVDIRIFFAKGDGETIKEEVVPYVLTALHEMKTYLFYKKTINRKNDGWESLIRRLQKKRNKGDLSERLLQDLLIMIDQKRNE